MLDDPAGDPLPPLECDRSLAGPRPTTRTREQLDSRLVEDAKRSVLTLEEPQRRARHRTERLIELELLLRESSGQFQENIESVGRTPHGSASMGGGTRLR